MSQSALGTRRGRLVVATALVAALVTSVAGTTPDAGATPPARPAIEPAAVVAATEPGAVSEPAAAAAAATLDWEACHTDLTAATGTPFECATMPVPLDHDDPDGPQVDLAVLRVPAADPDQRIGSILLNPGGPGGSGVDFALALGPVVGQLWGPEVRARFDLVGFDPRGIARSTALRCFTSQERATASVPDTAYPTTRRDHQDWSRSMRTLWRACERDGGAIADHMSTANVARDMDLLRAAVGDEQLTYVGLSYGSHLGVTYANLFPDRVRSVVVDGVLDPVRWANQEGEVPFTTRLRSDEGADETLDRLFELCDAAGAAACALAPNSAATFDDLLERVRAEPVSFVDPALGEPLLITHDILASVTLQVLYNPFAYQGWAQWTAGLAATARGAPSPGLSTVEPARGAASAPWASPGAGAEPTYRNGVEGLPGVGCLDSNNPDDLDAWRDAAADASQRFGVFGSLWTWISAPCAGWPAADDDRHLGPWDAETANPVLVVGNRWDPATRYEGAQAVRDLLPNSSLVTVEVPGHTSLGLSGCAGFATASYLLDPTTAPALDGMVCPAEFDPFAPFPPAAGARSANVAPGIVPGIRDALPSAPVPTPGPAAPTGR